MTDTLVQIIFGRPAIITSIPLSIVGLMLRKPALLILAGIICMLFTYYVSNGFRNPAVVLPLFPFGSAYAFTRQKKLIAWLCITPLVVIAAALAYTVLTQ